MCRIRLIIMAAVFVFAAGAGCLADETAAQPDVKNEKDNGLEAFGNKICTATLSGLKDLFNIMNLQFGLRLTLDEAELKKSGMSIEDALKENEKMLRTYAQSQEADSAKPESCKVMDATPVPCEDLYKKIAKRGAFGMPVAIDKIKAAADKMKIESCGLVTASTKSKGSDAVPVEFAAAQIDGGWGIIMIFEPEKVENKAGDNGKGDKPETK
jgi:hypothetical protein